MKKLLIDAGIIILMCVVFFVFKVTGIIQSLVALLVGIAVHILLGWLLDKKAKKAEEEIIRELDSKAEEKKSLKDLCSELYDKYSDEFPEEIRKFQKLVSSFFDKKTAILQITELTGENSEYVIQASDETETYICGLARLLEIKLITLKALDSDSRQYKDTLSQVKNILEIAEENCEEYSNLLTEASNAADNTADNTQLRSAVESLRTLREKNQSIYQDSLFPNEDEFDGLFGTTTPSDGDKYSI